jgi:hypothetical protein
MREKILSAVLSRPMLPAVVMFVTLLVLSGTVVAGGGYGVGP